MRCWKIRARLVAYQDGELAPGEMHLVREHLADCARCRNLEKRLEEVTPRLDLRVPPQVKARLDARVTGPVLRARLRAAPAPRPRTLPARLVDWLQRDAGFSMGAVLASALLAMLLGWSLGQLGRTTLPRLALWQDPDVAAQEVDPPAGSLPSDQYRPAAYTPADDASYH